MNVSTLNTSKFIRRSEARSLALACILSLAGTLALAWIVCLLGITPAEAGTPATRSVTVSFRDLDLSSVEGARTLYGRIQSAAKQVCGYAGADLIEQSIWKSCYRHAISDAVGKVNSPLLTAVYTGRPPEMTAMVTK
jgi:UrcA family protein